MEFHEKLQELRKQKGLTQEELAQAVFVSRTAVSKWESGRGYPNIDSLKALSKYFCVTIDDLLSGEELLTIAQEDNRKIRNRFRDLVFGALDCSAAMFFFLPFFGQQRDGMIRAVSLAALTEISPWLKTAYYAVIIGTVLWGILILALQNCRKEFWSKNKYLLSLGFNVVGTLLFIASQQPYGAAFLFLFLMIKGILLTKKP